MVGRHFDDTVGKVMGGQMGHRFDLLLGRRTYDIFAASGRSKTMKPAHAINSATKYVVSHRPVSLDWKTTVLINGDVVERIKKLKAENGPDLQVHGERQPEPDAAPARPGRRALAQDISGRTGPRKHLYADGTMPGGWQLLDSQVSPSGVIVDTYGRAGEVKLGSFIQFGSTPGA